ncbi:MAG: FKBP-type peptidyl-prolyl cis-trans isomerase [Tannerella sp.]|jgi:FKBP-type peptidyl-prolyl cis-trans isomerase|nr:FKBP-type peptidyl-prolyl cis-trans isomerase [Tannerella sp.]
MKKISVLVMVAGVAMGMMATSCSQTGGSNVKLSNGLDSACYSIGANYGYGLGQQASQIPGGVLNKDALIAGFIAGMKDSASLKMTMEEMQSFPNTYFMKIQAQEGEVTKAEGDAFLASNKGKAGVITTESGLQYKVITEGTGAKPIATDQVKVHYTLKLLDGTVLESSVDRGEPATFGVTQVIPGWTEALQIMPVGSKYILWIPSELAYGAQGAGQNIKPNSTLEFEVELLEIVKE